jgi:ABC-type proline/glycine betaine transport system permease subunit
LVAALLVRIVTHSEFGRMNDLIRTFTERGDLAHLALFLWASASSALLALTLRELFTANARFDAFVRELAKFNRRVRK